MSIVQAIPDAIALGTLFALVAMGVGLVFGVIRLVNFAHGELITAGAYALFLTKDLPTGLRAVIAVGVVVALAALMEIVYRPLKNVAPATMLVATFAVSFLLQNVALVVFGAQGGNIGFLSGLNQAFRIGPLQVRWITLVGLVVGSLSLAAMALFLRRTDLGLQMRAAAADVRMAKLLGVPTTRVVRAAFLLGGVLAGVVTLALAVQRPLVTPTFGFQVLIPALVGVVVGGIDRLVPATLGGFSIGVATVLISVALPGSQRVFLNSVLFALVITVLLVKPAGLFAGRSQNTERV
ncbi:MAG: branched-chain amino acid ABC transporter permease [Actinobacteria bacterium]|nr:branched-chain amino acid ABC transporter permease [Actinomycetota bacterium]